MSSLQPLLCVQGDFQTETALRRSEIVSDQLRDFFQAMIQRLPMDEQLLGGRLLGQIGIQIDVQRLGQC